MAKEQSRPGTVPGGRGLPAFARGWCDDAAVFPPGLMSLVDAVPAHLRHEAAGYAELVGPLILAAPTVVELAPLLRDRHGRHGPLNLSVTAPAGPGQLAAVFAAVADLPVRLCAVEVAVPPAMGPGELRAALDRALDGAGEVEVFVEVPRDERRPEIIGLCADAGYPAKFRTGGIRAELYPDEAELAAAIRAVVGAGVSFKATAGLHHALRNTDPETGFEQHGFLNLLLATDAALCGAAPAEVTRALAARDPEAVAGAVTELGAGRTEAARALFRSFGTCSITDPLTELIELDLIPATVLA